jgi:hypothetical protein
MLLRKLRLDNVKCFAQGTEVDFTIGKGAGELPHRWAVVCGDNGLGKSTLLRSIAIALTGQPALNFLLPSAEGWVRGAQKTASIGVEFTRNDSKGTGDVISGQRKKPIEVSWRIAGRRSTTIGEQRVQAGSVILDQRDDWELFEKYIATDKERHGWLLCGYGPLRRLTGASSDIAEKVSEHGRAARLITLFDEKAALTSAERWLIQLDHEAKKNDDDSRLAAVRAMLNEGLLHGGVTLGGIEPDGVFFRTPFSDRVAMSDLSDGYRTSLALAIDLLRHITYCFDIEKVMRVDDSGAGRTITAEGVVLIDEIDSHLHPRWQRTIGDWLHRTFPNLQFIVATHSPLIAERVSLDDGMVVRLERRTQGKGEVVRAECLRTTERSLTADQNLTSPNFGLSSTRDVIVEAVREKIDWLTKQVRAGTAKKQDREELRRAQLRFEFEAPVAASESAKQATG